MIESLAADRSAGCRHVLGEIFDPSLSLCLQSQLAEEITFETLKKAIGENKEKFLRLLLASLLCGLSGASP